MAVGDAYTPPKPKRPRRIGPLGRSRYGAPTSRLAPNETVFRNPVTGKKEVGFSLYSAHPPGSSPSETVWFNPQTGRPEIGNTLFNNRAAMQRALKGAGGAAAPPPAPTPAPAPHPVTPDSQYFSEQAQRRFKANQAEADMDRTAGYDATDYQEGLRRLDEQQPLEQRDLRERANSAGLLYSSRLGEQLGQQATNYQRQRGDQTLAFDRREAERAAARRAIEAGYSIDDAAAYAEAIGRQLQRDADAASSGALAGSPAKPSPSKPGPGAAKPLPGVHDPKYAPPVRAGVHDQVRTRTDENVRKPFTDEQIRQNAIKRAGRRRRRR